MFVGNLVLVVGILLGMFLLHIVVVSGVEAFWLTKVRLPPTPQGTLLTSMYGVCSFLAF